MQTKPKSNSAITTAIDVDGKLVFNVIGAGVVKFDPAKAAPVLKAKAERHGWFQRISDSAAMPRTDDKGKLIPPAERAKAQLDAMTRLIEHYESGTAEWSRVSASTGPKGGLLFKALCRMFPTKTPDEVRAWLDAKSKVEQAALRMSPKVRQIFDEMALEAGDAGKIDADMLLAEFQTSEDEEEESEGDVETEGESE